MQDFALKFFYGAFQLHLALCFTAGKHKKSQYQNEAV
jgi:hypothetical protein